MGDDAASYVFHFLGYAAVATALGVGGKLYHTSNPGSFAGLQGQMRSQPAMRWFCIASSTEEKKIELEMDPLEKEPLTEKQETAAEAPVAAAVDSPPAYLFGVCFLGLQGSYLSWGFIQEMIMTQEYDGERFQYSEVLVFLNRFLAMLVAYVVLQMRPSAHSAPPFKYTITSVANVISSWLQYEALKFVNFPMQVLSKSSKILFAMLMGKVVNGSTYPWKKYANALLITAGLAIFKIYDNDSKGKDKNADVAAAKFTLGAFLLLGYVLCDSFTSNWQQSVFKQHKVNSYQMMLGVNVASCAVIICSLAAQGVIFEASDFMLRHPDCLMHALLMSVFSAVGQLFIYFTIEKFGAVVFASIMTARQLFSIVLSVLSFGHTISAGSMVGLFLVFMALVAEVLGRVKK